MAIFISVNEDQVVSFFPDQGQATLPFIHSGTPDANSQIDCSTPSTWRALTEYLHKSFLSRSLPSAVIPEALAIETLFG